MDIIKDEILNQNAWKTKNKEIGLQKTVVRGKTGQNLV